MTVAHETWEHFEAVWTERNLKNAYQPVFRGHACQGWNLETTLERHAPKTGAFAVNCYMELAKQAGMRILKQFPEDFAFLKPQVLSGLEKWKDGSLDSLLACLRQNGFPSPLLDWSECPFVAAFFAFEHADECNRVAIFEAKPLNSVRTPRVRYLDKDLETDPKHKVQRAKYTVCYTVDGCGAEVFETHGKGLQASSTEGYELPYFKKHTLPASLRNSVLRMLEERGIDRRSLFMGSEVGPGDKLRHLINQLAVELIPKTPRT